MSYVDTEFIVCRSPKKPKLIPQSLDVPHPSPERWKEAYDAIKEMRARTTAPVDTMGCDQAQWKEQDPKVRLLRTVFCRTQHHLSDAEPPVCNSYFTHALVSDQGRSHRRCSGKAPYGIGRIALCRCSHRRRRVGGI